MRSGLRELRANRDFITVSQYAENAKLCRKLSFYKLSESIARPIIKSTKNSRKNICTDSRLNKQFCWQSYLEETMEERKLIVKAAKMITDDMDIKLGKKKMDRSRPEYRMLDLLLTDEMAEMVLKMGRRKPITFEHLVKKMGWEETRTRRVLDSLTDIGVVEFNRHNEKKERQYVVPVFVVGMAENFMMNKKLIEKYPTEMAKFQDEMGVLPMKSLTQMIPPGGAGTGFHVIPVESAIPKESQSLDIEHISHWLDKYEGHYVTMPCVCRRAMRLQGKGCGELEDGVCIGLGDYADYLLETDKEVKPISRKDLEKLLVTLEENGYMHQITNGDGRDDIFSICNCNVGSCYGLRCSQLFNQPNSSASAYRAEVTTEKCVACGKCVEACPAGAARLGQKLCTSHGPVTYPKQPIPDETKDWGPQYWNKNYRDDNQKNCYDTGTAPCKTACPAHVAIQGYIELAKEGRYEDALELIRLDNPFPAVCGSVCNKRCEKACTRGLVDDPLSIDEIKKFLARQELENADRFIPKKLRHWGYDRDHTQKIAVIGAGPAGMTCAYYLSNMGYPVTVFEKSDRPGGMMMNGLPNFRLEKNVVNAEIDILRKMGVEFRCGVDVGTDVTIPKLREEGYQGFYLAIGLQNGGSLGIPGSDAQGVMSGIDFMRKVNHDLSYKLQGKVVVIGGGNIGADVARTAVRCGAESVDLYCLEDYDHMPMGPEDQNACKSDGITIHDGWGQTEVLAKEGKCQGIRFHKCISVRNAEGRFDPKFDDSRVETAECSTVLFCIGQKPDWGKLLEGTKVKLSPRGFVIADPLTMQTSDPDIFAGGDIFTGQKFVIDAIAGGREGAISLHRFVNKGQDLKLARNRRDFIELNKDDVMIPSEALKAPKRTELRHDSAKTHSFRDDRIVMTKEDVEREASRCLHCGATYVDQNRCIGCGLCTTKCRFDAIHLVRNHPEFANYCDADEGPRKILEHGIKRKIKLTIQRPAAGAKA